MITVAGLLVAGFFVFMGVQARQSSEQQRPRKPLPRAVVRDRR